MLPIFLGHHNTQSHHVILNLLIISIFWLISQMVPTNSYWHKMELSCQNCPDMRKFVKMSTNQNSGISTFHTFKRI